jgi:hypothetical protein
VTRFTIYDLRFTLYDWVSRFTFHVSRFTLLLALLALVACGGGRSGYTAQQQTVDGVTIALERPQQVAVLQQYEFFITLKDTAGQPIDGATVFIEQDMPSMKMEANQPLAEPLGDGQYSVKGAFTMDGAWRVTVHATIAGKDHTAAFDQTVTPVE